MNQLSAAAVLVTIMLVAVVLASAGAYPVRSVVVIGDSGHDFVTIPVVVVTLTVVAIAMVNRIRKLRSS
jgi:hypothetical protein